ncbi:bifunctional N(6)-L-threonylcarbamoyladenine synthase/serine/threonine protein kinase [Candidatus Woesearchaeota archaeon]|nr:bifunctional N(6)-L-threonylcarbamoyladenine synthase/serine/threonine protein kinase [Candidatus Woesearchaeota archaeon]
MNCLGIETTAHTFGVAIVTDKGEVRANMKDAVQIEEGGMIPAAVADHHVEVCGTVVKKALEKAQCSMKDIDLIAFSQGPGIGNCLTVGTFVARVLASLHKKPLIGVNHCIAHLEIGRLKTEAKDPVLLYASGANTQVIALEGGRYRIFGETLDIGVGNFLDQFARYMGLGFPGGPKIYELACKGKNFIELPYVVKGMDLSFGGILTNLKQKYDSHQYSKEDLAYSAQETVFAMLLEVSERAMAHTGKNELLLGGGVACNVRLQDMAKQMCRERNAQCFVPANEFLVDNAAMIAWLGTLEHKAGITTPVEQSKVLPYWRTDEVEVIWS